MKIVILYIFSYKYPINMHFHEKTKEEQHHHLSDTNPPMVLPAQNHQRRTMLCPYNTKKGLYHDND